MKRRRTSGGSVTGGTGDIKPQILTALTGTATAVATYIVNAIALPVPRFGTTKGRSTIFEILWVDWYIGILDQSDQINTKFAFLSTSTNRNDGETATQASFVVDLSDPRVFGAVYRSKNQLTSGTDHLDLPLRVNLTDENGNGVLVATDRLLVVGGDIAGTAADNYVAKIAYRLVDVTLEEYIGIVQSQQGTVQ